MSIIFWGEKARHTAGITCKALVLWHLRHGSRCSIGGQGRHGREDGEEVYHLPIYRQQVLLRRQRLDALAEYTPEHAPPLPEHPPQYGQWLLQQSDGIVAGILARQPRHNADGGQERHGGPGSPASSAHTIPA